MHGHDPLNKMSVILCCRFHLDGLDGIVGLDSLVPTHMKSQGRFPLRKISIGSDQIGLFPSCIIRTVGPKKVENTSTLYRPGC